jgi:broad specificity phosphatase PhoE
VRSLAATRAVSKWGELDDTTVRRSAFLEDLVKNYDGKRVMIIGHRATWYGLEHLVGGVGMEELVSAKFKWQEGWGYEVDKVKIEVIYL